MKTKIKKQKTKTVTKIKKKRKQWVWTIMLCWQYPWHDHCVINAVKCSHASVTINSTASSLLVYLSWEKNIASAKVTKISSKVKDISSSTSLTCKTVLKGHCINKSISFSELSSLTQTNVILSSHNELIIACTSSELSRLASFVLKVLLWS